MRYTDPRNNYTFVLERSLEICKVYDGYWCRGGPSMAELNADLREVT